MKRWGFIVLPVVAILIGLFLYVRSSGRPPTEEEMVANFFAHRVAYERLRDMLLADRELLRIAKWGVETTESVGVSVPPNGHFPVDRYREYLVLLKETHGLAASRAQGVHTESVCVLIWASGWAGDTRHVQICWVDHEPTPQVISLKGYYRAPNPRHPVFRKIEEHWYLWADW